MADDADTMLVRDLRRYSATWAKTIAPYFGVSERVINRCLADEYGSVMNADLATMYLRLSTLFTAIADGEITGTPSAHEVEKTFRRDISLDIEDTVPREIRTFNSQIVQHYVERFDLAISTVNRALHTRFGPVKDADTGQLFTRAAHVLSACAQMEMTPEQERAAAKKSKKKHEHSEQWWAVHATYIDQVKRAADLYSIPVSNVNSVMHKRRGPVHGESDTGIINRLSDLYEAFPELSKEPLDE